MDNVIERAFELAPSCHQIDEIRKTLRREGYSNVDAHLAGPKIRAELTKLLNKTGEP
ncbi:MAG: hypothetical protein ABI454_06245 [Sphingomicrobium sp.]